MALLEATATAIPRPAVEADAVAREAVPAGPWEDTELPADTRTADTIRGKSLRSCLWVSYSLHKKIDSDA